MLEDELIPIIDSLNINIEDNKKIKCLELRKTIILLHVIENIYEIYVCLLLNFFYIIFILYFNLIFCSIINSFDKNKLKLYSCTLFLKLIIKLSLIYYFNVIPVLTILSIIINCFEIKIIYKFINILTTDLNNNDIESLLGGWSPRKVIFNY